MKRPNFIPKNPRKLKRLRNKVPKRFHYPERSKKILTEEYKKLSLV